MSAQRKVCKDCRRRRAISKFRVHRFRSGPWVSLRCIDCEKRYQFGMNVNRYGITVEEFAWMEATQGFTCAICPEPLGPSPHIDHCHAEGHVRGLLCSSCNLGLGHFRDDVEALSSAIRYLAA